MTMLRRAGWMAVIGVLAGGCGDPMTSDDAAMTRADAPTSVDAFVAPGTDVGPTPDAASVTDAASASDAPSATDDAASGGTYPSCDARTASAPSPLAGTCSEYRNRTDGSTLEAGCTGGGGTVVMRPCELTDAVGRCTMGAGTPGEQILFYYSSYMPPDGSAVAAYGASRCAMRMGTWEEL